MEMENEGGDFPANWGLPRSVECPAEGLGSGPALGLFNVRSEALSGGFIDTLVYYR